MTKLVDLSQVRSAWAHRYGSARATAMLAGSRGPVAAYDSRYGLRRYGRDEAPDDSDMGGGASGGGDDPDSRMETIKRFLKNSLIPKVRGPIVQNDEVVRAAETYIGQLRTATIPTITATATATAPSPRLSLVGLPQAARWKRRP